MNIYQRMKFFMLLFDQDSGGNSGGSSTGSDTATSTGKTDGEGDQDGDKKIEMTTAQLGERIKRELRKVAKTPAELAALLDEDAVSALLEQDGVKAVLDKRSAKKKAEEQGEFEKLYKETKGEADKLKPKVERLEAENADLSKALDTTVKARRKLLAPEYHELLDALPLLKQVEWLNKNADKLQSGGVPGGQKAGSNGLTKEQAEAQAAAYAQYYGRI